MTKTTQKKPRSDSAKAAINAAINASLALPDCPAHVKLRERDRPFWADVLRARARDEWTQADLIVAAQLARCMSDIEAESEAMENEGSVIKNDKGTAVMNPRNSVLEQLARREMALMRTLKIAGAGTGDTRDLVKGRKLQREAEKARDEVTGDLLA